MKSHKAGILFLSTLLLLTATSNQVSAQRRNCKELALELFAEINYEIYLDIKISKDKRKGISPVLSKEEYIEEYITAIGEIPTIFHDIGIFEIDDGYPVHSSDLVCCTSDSTFVIDLDDEFSDGDTLMLGKTLSLLNYIVKAESPRKYTNNELITILELGLTLNAHRWDHSWATYPQVLRIAGLAWMEVEAHVLSQDNLDDTVTRQGRGQFLEDFLNVGLEDWIGVGIPKTEPPFAIETSKGIEITIHTLLIMDSVQRNVFLWNNGQFTLATQKLLKRNREY